MRSRPRSTGPARGRRGRTCRSHLSGGGARPTRGSTRRGGRRESRAARDGEGPREREARSRPSSRSSKKAARKRRTARHYSFQNLEDRGIAACEGASEVRTHRERVRAEVAFLERADEDVAHLVLVQKLEDPFELLGGVDQLEKRDFGPNAF